MKLFKKIKHLFFTFTISISLVFLPVTIHAGPLKSSAKLVIAYASVKMITSSATKGLKGAVRKKAAKVFWKMVKKHPDKKSDIIAIINNQSVKHPKFKKRFNILAKRVREKLSSPVVHGKSRVKKISGRNPLNYKYSGKSYPQKELPVQVRGGYPHGTPF